MPALSKIDIWNRAIARLPAKEIASIDEASLEARECRRFYPSVISGMLEGPHDWSFAIQRTMLAEVANDRPNEWAKAYVLPSNCASPIRIIPNLESLGIGLPVPLAGDPFAEVWPDAIATIEAPYQIEGGVLYTNVEQATLAFVINDIAGLNISALVIEAARLQLAADLAVAVKKDSTLRKDIVTEAEVALSRAIADDRNRQPESYGCYVSEAMLARHGGIYAP
jgi:hypothetical protein